MDSKALSFLKPSIGGKEKKSPEGSKKITVSPVLRDVGKLAAGVAAVATGSATGNLRNKCALQPGHSLMDWIRLGNSGKDLTGVGAKAGTLIIGPGDLATHCKQDDAWLAIRGRVYNVTAYMPFHPGGVDELMRGVGKDATTLFNQVHAWVNYESILQKCFVGRLSSLDPQVDAESLFYGNEEKAQKSTAEISENVKTSPTNIANGSANSSPTSNTKAPRFDWIQKSETITFIFYTNSYSNPSITVSRPSRNSEVTIKFICENKLFVNTLKLLNNIHWPCKINVNYETGKIEVVFRKIVSKIWDNFGSAERAIETVPENYEKIEFVIKNKSKINHNCYTLNLQRNDHNKIKIPIGYHLRIFGPENNDVSRSYTPIPVSFMRDISREESQGDLCFLIKSYPEGQLSPYICSKEVGDILQLSSPLGTFELAAIKDKQVFLLISAGTGITPMLTLLTFILERRINKCLKVELLSFNRTESDILCREDLESLKTKDERFEVEYILSEPNDKWTAKKGHITKDLIKSVIDSLCDKTLMFPADVFVTVCGPSGFTNLSKQILDDIGYKNQHMHLFQG